MSIDPDISRQVMEEELEALKPLASTFGWTVEPDLTNLTVRVTMRSSVDNEVYIIEACCDDYKALPPEFEFIHPVTGERGKHSCYPKGSSYFHSAPCICVQWNRKAYRSPHPEWEMVGWTSARPGMTTLGDMFHLIQLEMNKPGQYTGRMT